MGFEAQASGESAVSIQGGYTLYGGEKDISGGHAQLGVQGSMMWSLRIDGYLMIRWLPERGFRLITVGKSTNRPTYVPDGFQLGRNLYFVTPQLREKTAGYSRPESHNATSPDRAGKGLQLAYRVIPPYQSFNLHRRRQGQAPADPVPTIYPRLDISSF